MTSHRSGLEKATFGTEARKIMASEYYSNAKYWSVEEKSSCDDVSGCRGDVEEEPSLLGCQCVSLRGKFAYLRRRFAFVVDSTAGRQVALSFPLRP